MTRRGFFGVVVAALLPKPTIQLANHSVIHFSDPFGVKQVVVKWAPLVQGMPFYGLQAADHINDGTSREWMGIPR